MRAIPSGSLRDVAYGAVRLDYLQYMGGPHMLEAFRGRLRFWPDGTGGNGFRGRSPLDEFTPGQLELLPHQDQVVPGLGEWRYAAMSCNRGFPGVIGGQGQGVIARVQVQQVPQIPGSALNVFD